MLWLTLADRIKTETLARTPHIQNQALLPPLLPTSREFLFFFPSMPQKLIGFNNYTSVNEKLKKMGMGARNIGYIKSSTDPASSPQQIEAGSPAVNSDLTGTRSPTVEELVSTLVNHSLIANSHLFFLFLPCLSNTQKKKKNTFLTVTFSRSRHPKSQRYRRTYVRSRSLFRNSTPKDS